jgi:N4-gp56 family major capsid protein
MPATLLGTPEQAKTFFDRRLIKAIRRTQNWYKSIATDTMATRSGNTVEFRSFPSLAVASTPVEITDGVLPTETTFTVTKTTATQKQYGAWVGYTDQIDLMAFDPVRDQIVLNLGVHAAETMEQLIANQHSAQLNVQYANGKANRAALTAADVINRKDIIQMVNTLRKNKAPRNSAVNDDMPDGDIANSQYVLMVSSNVAADIQNDPQWVQYLINNANSKGLPDSAVASFAGVLIMWSDFCPPFASTTTVHQSYMFSKHWLAGMGVGKYGGTKQFFETISKPLNSGGIDNALNQRGSEGWKGFQAFLTRQPGWVVKYESGTAFS